MNAFDFSLFNGPKPQSKHMHHEHCGPKPPVPPCVHGPKPPVPPCAHGPIPTPYSIIHPFNKVCFKNYTEAVSMLKHKDLIPGEYAFAYYYDKTADFGVNAIAAVGSIKVGAANIIFNNAEVTDKVLNDLKTIVQSNNEKVETVTDIIDQLTDKFNIISSVIDNVSIIDSQLNDISNKIVSLENEDVSIKEHVDTIDNQIISINDYITEHIQEYNMLSDIVSKLVIDSSNNDSTLDSLDEYLQSLNGKIESLEQSLLVNISAGDTAVKTELLNIINNKFADTAGDLTDLKNEIISDVDNKFIQLNNDIYDLKVTVNTSIPSQINKAKEQAIEVSKQYIDNLIGTVIDDNTTSSVKLEQRLHLIEDSIYDVSKNTDRSINNILRDIDEFKEDTDRIITRNDENFKQELNRQKTYLSDSINQFKEQYTVETRTTVDQKIGQVLGKINDLQSNIISNNTDVNNRIGSLESQLSTYKITLTEELQSQIASTNTLQRNYIDKKISDERTYNDTMYARKTDIPAVLTATKGLTINNGVISLNIDANGILRVGENSYQLTKL